MKKNIDSLKTLASGAIVSLIFGVIGYVLMFGFKIFTARFLGPEKFGLVEMSITILNIGAIIALLGIHAGVSRYISVYEERNDFEKLGGYLKFIFNFPILASLAVSTLIFVLAHSINNFFNFNEIFVTIIRIISLVIPFKVVNEVIYQIFYAKKKILIQNIGNNIIEKVILVGGILGVYFFNLGIIAVAWLFFASIFIAFIFNLVYLKLKIKFAKARVYINDYSEWLAFSLPLFLANMSIFAMNWTDNIVIGKILTSKELGIYAASFSLASFLLFFQTAFVSVFVPIMSRFYAKRENESFLFVYNKAQNWVFGLSLPFAVIFIFFSKELLASLFGEAFIEGYIPLIIITIGITFNVYTGMNGSLMKIIKKTKFLFKIRLLMAIINIIFNIFMVRKFGIIGAAISTSFVIAGEQLIYMIKSKKYFGIIHDTVKNVKFLILSITIMLIFYSIFNIFQFSHNLINLSLFIFFYLIVYFYFSFIVKAFDKNDQIIFKSILYEK